LGTNQQALALIMHGHWDHVLPDLPAVPIAEKSIPHFRCWIEGGEGDAWVVELQASRYRFDKGGRPAGADETFLAALADCHDLSPALATESGRLLL
jgi:hypothetical protein